MSSEDDMKARQRAKSQKELRGRLKRDRFKNVQRAVKEAPPRRPMPEPRSTDASPPRQTAAERALNNARADTRKALVRREQMRPAVAQRARDAVAQKPRPRIESANLTKRSPSEQLSRHPSYGKASSYESFAKRHPSVGEEAIALGKKLASEGRSLAKRPGLIKSVAKGGLRGAREGLVGAGIGVAAALASQTKTGKKVIDWANAPIKDDVKKGVDMVKRGLEKVGLKKSAQRTGLRMTKQAALRRDSDKDGD